MASNDEMDVFNTGKHTKVGDIVIIGGDINLYKVTSTEPLDLKNITEYQPNRIGKMFNLTHFIQNFKEYMTLVKNTTLHDPWGIAAVEEYEKYILGFKDYITRNFPLLPEYYTFSEFLIFCKYLGTQDMNDHFDILKKTDLIK